MAYSTLHARVSPAVRDMLIHNRDRGHVHVMSAFPRGLGENPRKAAGVLWYLDSSGDLLVRSENLPQNPGLLGQVISVEKALEFKTDDAIELQAVIACQKTPMPNLTPEQRELLDQGKNPAEKGKEKKPGQGMAYRSRLVIVPEAERPAWAVRRLSLIGVSVGAEDLHLSAQTTAHMGKGRIPFIELKARVTVVDALELNKKMASGWGKGKNYGLGLIRAKILHS